MSSTWTNATTGTRDETVELTTEQVLENAAELCQDANVDAITRTEWGNAFIFKGKFDSILLFWNLK